MGQWYAVRTLQGIRGDRVAREGREGSEAEALALVCRVRLSAGRRSASWSLKQSTTSVARYSVSTTTQKSKNAGKRHLLPHIL